MNKQKERLKEILKEKGWRYNEKLTMCEAWSPAGENIVIECRKRQSLTNAIKEMYELYDINEHIDFVKDAHEIEKMLKELYSAII